MKCSVCGKEKSDVSLKKITHECYERIKHLLEKHGSESENPTEGVQGHELDVMICKNCQDSI